jgi:hypothetical protein
VLTYRICDAQGSHLGTLTTARGTWGVGDMFFSDNGEHFRFLGSDFPQRPGDITIVAEPIPIPAHWSESIPREVGCRCADSAPLELRGDEVVDYRRHLTRVRQQEGSFAWLRRCPFTGQEWVEDDAIDPGAGESGRILRLRRFPEAWNAGGQPDGRRDFRN